MSAATEGSGGGAPHNPGFGLCGSTEVERSHIDRRPSQTVSTEFAYPAPVTKVWNRFYGKHDLHFAICSCYRRQPQLGSAGRRHHLARVLEQFRQRYRFVVVGYLFMPEHIHLLITEPEVGETGEEAALHAPESVVRGHSRTSVTNRGMGPLVE